MNEILNNIINYLKCKKIDCRIISKEIPCRLLGAVYNYIDYDDGIITINWFYAIDNMTDSLTRLAHEAGHILLKHYLIPADKDDNKRYPYEKAAWKKACKIVKELRLPFNKSLMKKILNEYKE